MSKPAIRVQHLVPADNLDGKEVGGACERLIPAEVARLGASLAMLAILIFGMVAVVAAWAHFHVTTATASLVVLFYHGRVAKYIRESRATGGNDQSSATADAEPTNGGKP